MVSRLLAEPVISLDHEYDLLVWTGQQLERILDLDGRGAVALPDDVLFEEEADDAGRVDRLAPALNRLRLPRAAASINWDVLRGRRESQRPVL